MLSYLLLSVDGDSLEERLRTSNWRSLQCIVYRYIHLTLAFLKALPGMGLQGTGGEMTVPMYWVGEGSSSS